MTDLADRAIFNAVAPTPAYAPSRARSFLLAQSKRVLSYAEIYEIVEWIYSDGGDLGADPAIAFAQFCVETDNGRFTGQVPATAHNPAGIGAINDGASYIVYPLWAAGVLAYWVHLLAWCDELPRAKRVTLGNLDEIDVRLPLVAVSRATKGKATSWRSLGGRWAVEKDIDWRKQANMAQNYGTKIASRHAQILATTDTEANMSGSTERIKLALAAGHHNTSGGDAYEHAQTGELCEAIARHAAPLGFDVRVVQPDGPDADTEPGDGDVAGSLDLVGNTVVKWANEGWRARCFIETHTEGGGGLGVFAINPDWGSDVDTTVKDQLGPLLARAVAAATGLALGAGGDGVMSERETGVGASGSRLGIFRTTAPLAADCDRMIIEFGAHDKQPDKTIAERPGFADACGRAVAYALAAFYGLHNVGNVTTPTAPTDAATAAARRSLLSFSDAIPFAYRGNIEWEGVVDLSTPDFGGAANEQLAKYERCVVHRFNGANYVLTLALWDRLRREGKIKRWPSGAAVALGES